MKIKSINVQNFPPITNLSIDNMGDVVIIAGANGSGKTRLKEAIKHTFQDPRVPRISLTIESTKKEEKDNLGEKLEVVKGINNPKLQKHMASRSRGGTYTSTVIQIDSDRSVQPIKFKKLDLSTPDPDDVEISSTYFLDNFANRWPDIVNKIFQKYANRDNKIAAFVKSEEGKGKTTEDILKKYPDPFKPYHELFARLLPDKLLEPIDPKQPKEFQYKIKGDERSLPFNSLSSGEQEVIKITFDLLWKKITHSIFLFDEPELHLHPTLTFRLIETLKEMGGGTNQFIFFTHAADLISTYYSSGNVYFIDSDTTSSNQAHRLSDLKENHPDLVELMGENLGLFAVGKKLVFVEGENSSIDRLSYHAIAQKGHSDLNFIPVGSVENILLLQNTTKQLKNSLFGINFYMIRDRDGLSDKQLDELEKNSTLRCLKRRQLENYLLDSDILAKVADRFCLDEKWKNKETIEKELLQICTDSLSEALDLLRKDFLKSKLSIPIPRLKDIQSKSSEETNQEFIKGIATSLGDMEKDLSKDNLKNIFKTKQEQLEKAIKDGTWRNIFPGKILFRKICTSLKAEQERVRQAYIELALDKNIEAFRDITDIYNDFSKQS